MILASTKTMFFIVVAHVFLLLWQLKDTVLVKVSIFEHFMFFACIDSSCNTIFNFKTAGFCHYS